MVSYEAFDRDVEINGQTVLTIVNEGMGKFSETYQQRALNALADEGITDPAPDEWYPQQAWLSAFEAIAEELQPHVLDRLGEQRSISTEPQRWRDRVVSVRANRRPGRNSHVLQPVSVSVRPWPDQRRCQTVRVDGFVRVHRGNRIYLSTERGRSLYLHGVLVSRPGAYFS
jgi:hypothetical protein